MFILILCSTEMCVGCCIVTKSWPILCDPMNCSPPGSSIHGISEARILEWVAISFPRGASRPRDGTHISHAVGRSFTAEPPGKPRSVYMPLSLYIYMCVCIYLCDVLLFLSLIFHLSNVSKLFTRKQVHLYSTFLKAGCLVAE